MTHAYDFTYDPVDQLVGATYRTTDALPSVLTRYGYVYDKVGNRTTEQVDDAPRVWAFNNANQMITQAGGGSLHFEGSVSEPATVRVQGQPALVDATNGFAGTAAVGTGTPIVTVTATDGSGNTSSESYEVDVTDASGTFAYDLNGNLTTRGTKTYEWDAENRLVRVLDNGIEVARFTYDGLGRRVEKVSGGVTRAFAYDGDDIVEERAGGTTTRIIHGPGVDQPLAAVTGSTPAYYLADHLGSIAQHTNSAQQVTFTRTYDPFGNLTSGVSTSGYAFTGREWDAEIGLYYYRARYYDAGLGRFIGADPEGLADGPNTYAYVRNLPVLYRDPSGTQRQLIPALVDGVRSAAPVVVGGASLAGGVISLPTVLVVGGLVVVGAAAWVYFAGDDEQARGLPPEGILPPVESPEKCKVGNASRPSEAKKGGKSLWDPKGGEWRWFPGDKHHNPHWDYNPHTRPNSPWQNVPYGDLPSLKNPRSGG